MRIGAGCRYGHVAAGLLAVAAISTPRLAAQRGGTLNRRAEVAPTVAAEPSRLAPAQGVLRTLVGIWRFEIRFAGNFDGAPDASGTRVVKTLFDDLRLEWTEELDHSKIRGQGVIGFDPTSGRFFSAAVYSAGSAPEFMTGSLDDAEPLITFSPMSITPSAGGGPERTQSTVLNMVDADHFTWAAQDRAWRAVFTRQK